MKIKYTFELAIDEHLSEDTIIIKSKSNEVGKEIIQHLNQLNQHSNSLVLKQEDEYLVIGKSEIIFAEVNQKIITVYTSDNKIETFGSLTSLYNNLPRISFIQITRFSIVNIQCIKKVEPSFSGNLLAHLSNGIKVNISRRYVPALKKQLGM